ncbi:hypothetical protein ACIG3E_39425 [Streptomyces sp. NPDC053474]|uniref:hypothetical protein n=1 Tax=Streptomyces sp. NPDC053474 TaxID=3365704 RepID=UPI0037D6914C
MGRHLYHLSAVVDELAPAMVGMPPGGGPWTKRRFPHAPPVVEIVGDRATGKTAVLDALYAGYHAHVPTAHVDLAEPPYSAAGQTDRERLDSANASPVTNLLFQMCYELSTAPKGNGRPLSFPRLSPALLLVTAWRREAATSGPVPPADLTAAEGELRELLTARHPDPRVRDALLRRWFTALGSVVAGLLPGVPGLEGVLQAASETLFDRKGQAPRLAWWRSRLDDANGDAVRRLFLLVQKFRRRGPDRAAVEAHLLDALLADIDGAYGPWGRKTRHPPLILLDNVDDVLRKRLLDPFVERYARLAQERPGHSRAMLPVVFASSLGRGCDPGLTPTTVEAPWHRTELCPPRTWLLRLGIPHVGDPHIRAMLSGTDYPAALPAVVERLSGGRTGCALLLTETAVERIEGSDPLDLDELLSLPSPDAGQPLAVRLLDQLLPDPALRDQALAVAPALETGAAADLLRLPRSDFPAPPPALQVRRLLDGTLERPHWNHRPWPSAYGRAPLITDRALRAILLHRLRTEGGPERWSHIHSRLAGHYNPGDVLAADSVRHDPRYLHHALALGLFDSLVVRALHHRYLRSAPSDWLRDLNLVAAAPQAFDGFAPEHAPSSGDLPPCPACADQESGAEAHAAIRLLLASVWRLSAPSAAPPSGHADRRAVLVRAALEALCTDYGRRPRPGQAYNAYIDAVAADGWIDALVNGVQAPDLPVV